MRNILLICFLCTGLTALAQHRSKEFERFSKEYVLDSIVSSGQRYLAKHENKTLERNQVFCRILNTKIRQGKFQEVDSLYKRERWKTKDPVQLAYLFREYSLLKSFETYFAKSQYYSFKSLKLMQYHKQREGEVLLLTDLAEFYRRTGDFVNGILFIEKAETTYNRYKLSNRKLLAQIYNRYAAIINEQGQHAKSIQKSRIALSIAEQINDLHLQAVSWNEIGFSYKNLDEVDLSISAYKKAETLWMRAGMFQDAVHVKYNIAQELIHTGRITVAVSTEMYLEILKFIEDNKLSYPKQGIYSDIMWNCKAENDFEGAFHYSRLMHYAEVEYYEQRNRDELLKLKEEYQSDLLKTEAEGTRRELKYSKLQTANEKAENKLILFTASGILICFLGIAFLYVRIRQSKRKLEQQSKVKDSLIQEIHHRVKNNLQFVSSLMNMQMKASTSQEEVYALNDATRRIKSMALVHEMLYNNDDSQMVSLKKYLDELLETLKEISTAGNQPVMFVSNVQDIQVNVNQSVALGMICSELVSNALKHAFKGVSDPCIELNVTVDQQSVCHFSLKDNGTGITFTDDFVEHLGMRLIDIFSRQLKGTYDFSNVNGLLFTLKFDS